MNLGKNIFRGLTILFCLTIATTLIVPVKAEAWTLNFTDNFNRADGAIGNNWVNSSGSYTISSNQLVANTGGNPWVDGVIRRPADEALTDQKISVVIPAGVDISGVSLWLSLRTQATAGTEYIIGSDHAAYRFAKSVGGSLGWLTDSTVAFDSYDSSHSYLIEASAVDTSPTTLAITVTDLTTDTVVATDSITDSTTELQTSGMAGFFTVSSVTLDDFKVYDSTTPPATSYTFTGPTAGQINTATSNYTITPDGLYTGTITPSDNGAGGSFSPSSLSFSNSSAAQTFTYTPASTGTKTLSVSASPALGTDPSSISVVVTTLPPGEVSITDSELVWSPYNWKFNSTSWAQTAIPGSYLKVAFTGSTLSLGIDTSTMTGIDLTSVTVHAYIDGSDTPVEKTLDDVADDILTFSSGLSSGSHYAKIYLSETTQTNDRWTTPTNVLRITKVQLASDGTGAVASLSSTPLAEKSRKIIMFGDSITEGDGTSQAENSYAAVIGQNLGVEYGQIGYGAQGWDVAGNGNIPAFYNSSSSSSSPWRFHYSGVTRMTNNSNLSLGFADGTPNAIFVNMGTNDFLNTTNTTNVTNKVYDFLADARSTAGSWPAIFVIVPFRFGNSDASTYKTALTSGFTSYINATDDSRTYLIDLGSGAYDTVTAHGSGVHPDDTGASLLADDIIAEVEDYIIDPVTTVSSVSVATTTSSATITWTTDAVASSIVDFGFTSSYASSTTETNNATSTRSKSHSVTLSNLASCSVYHYRARSRDLALENASSTDSTFSIGGCAGSAPISNTTSKEISGSGSLSNSNLTLTIPSSFSNTYSSASFQANELDATTFFATAGRPSGKSSVGNYVVDLRAISGSTLLSSFDKALTVTLAYNSGDLGSLSESSLTIYRYDSGTWTALDNCSVDTNAHTVSCETSHFSSFSIFGQTSSSNSGGGSSSNRNDVKRYGCKDPRALNYEYFAASNPSLCVYSGLGATTNIASANVASTNSSSASYNFTRDLMFGITGTDVRELQKILIAKDTGPAAKALKNHGTTQNFGTLTKNAVIEYQKAHNIKPSIGYFGPLTRASLK